MRQVARIALDTLLVSFLVWRVAVIARDAYYAWQVSREIGLIGQAIRETTAQAVE